MTVSGTEAGARTAVQSPNCIVSEVQLLLCCIVRTYQFHVDLWFAFHHESHLATAENAAYARRSGMFSP